jgi:archaemetzincin
MGNPLGLDTSLRSDSAGASHSPGVEMSDKIYLVPIGPVDEDILFVVGEGLAAALGREWDVSDPLPYPAYAFHQRRQQYLSDAILNQLRLMALPAERLLGLADLDLYTPGLNFVFGQASMGGREALIALPRLRQSFYGLPDDEALFHERAVKEAVHELGHTYGLGHCPDATCVMHFSNSLPDTDFKGKEFCTVCQVALVEQ